jgi:copper homeostasis protein CutC
VKITNNDNIVLGKLREEENLDKQQFKALIDAYIFSG